MKKALHANWLVVILSDWGRRNKRYLYFNKQSSATRLGVPKRRPFKWQRGLNVLDARDLNKFPIAAFSNLVSY
jgi:hypothetical protein